MAQPRVPVWGNKASKTLTEKTCGGWGSRRNSQPHRRVHWRDPQGPKMYTNPPTQESAPEGPNLFVGSGGSAWKLAERWAESWASGIGPSPTLPHIQHHNATTWIALPWWVPKAPLPYYVTGVETKKYGPNERIDQSSRRNTTMWWRDSQPIRCTVQNTGNQDAHRNGWVSSQNRGKSEGYEKWNKGKYAGNLQWREGNQDLDQRLGAEGRNKQHSTRIEWRNKNSKEWGEA